MRTRSWLRPCLAGLFVVAWGCVLFGDLSSRAFDPSDPSEQLDQAAAISAEFRRAGCLGWMSAVISDRLGKPAFHALLSAGILAGVPADHAGYKLMSGVTVLLLLLAFQLAVWRSLGAWPAVFASAWFSGSNVTLSQALYGGHSWLGQALLWTGIAAAHATGWERLAGSTRKSAAWGLCLSLAVLSSHHMALWIAPLLLFWAWRWAASRRGSWAAALKSPAGLAAGFAAPILLLEAATFAIPKRHYWEVMAAQFSAAAGLDPAYGGLHGYLFSLLGRSESPAFLALFGLATGAGLLRLARRWQRGETSCALHLLYPLAACAMLEAPQVLRLGRVYLPILPFLFACSGLGTACLLERIRGDRARAAAGLGLAALILLSGHGPRSAAWRAFHAGADIRRVTASAGPGASRLIVAGRSLPYVYLPGGELRVGTCRDLAAGIRSGAEWLLVSPYSHWFWRGFLDGRSFDIPVEEAFRSDVPYVPVPGVESIPFQIFTNEVLGYRLLRGGLPFPVENRLYRACDFADWALAGRCSAGANEMEPLRAACRGSGS